MTENTLTLKQEVRMLSRYIGLLTAKYITFIVLVCIYFPFRPASAYLAIFTLFFPLILRFLFVENRQKTSESYILKQTMKKYHFSLLGYRAEKLANPLVLLFLLIWQAALNPKDISSIMKMVPSALLILNVISRILSGFLFQICLHHRLTNPESLD